MNLEEIWKNIPGFENRYEVSNLGNVRSLQFHGKRRRVPKPLATHPVQGYPVLTLVTSEHRAVTYRVHRLVAVVWVSNPEAKPQVNHKNGVRSDNRATNLEWVTCQENVAHGWSSNGRKPTKAMLHGLDCGRRVKSQYMFCHEDFGVFTGGCYELIRAYPQLRMHPSHVNELVKHPDKFKSYKGWRLTSSGTPDTVLKKSGRYV